MRLDSAAISKKVIGVYVKEFVSLQKYFIENDD